MAIVINAIQEGGTWMIPIIVAFVFALAIAFERIYYIAFRANMNGAALMKEIRRSIMANKIDEAIAFCEARAKEGKALPEVLRAGLMAANRTEIEIESALEQATLDVFPRLNKRTPFLPMLANVATLSGLLGTIVGLIQAFDAVANAAPDQKQTLLAKGISIAMYTTAGGLVVAIPTLILNSIVVSRTTKIMDEIDLYAAQSLNDLRARRRQSLGSAQGA
jgi:biopolymer transport protein ExbB/TolQ